MYVGVHKESMAYLADDVEFTAGSMCTLIKAFPEVALTLVEVPERIPLYKMGFTEVCITPLLHESIMLLLFPYELCPLLNSRGRRSKTRKRIFGLGLCRHCFFTSERQSMNITEREQERSSNLLSVLGCG
jgi:hypothetical protein